MRRFLSILCAVLLIPMAANALVQVAPAGDKAKAVADNNMFAADLYAQLRTATGNLFFSPESVSMALAMTYAGARGDTAAEMASTLHFSLPQEKLHPAMADLLRELNGKGEKRAYQLKMANALWLEKDYRFLDSYLKLTQAHYDAGLNKVDFKGAPEPSRQKINEWVEEQTADKIKDLIPSGLINDQTRLVLTNAVYFKSAWMEPFEKSMTKEEDFFVTPAQVVKTPLMQHTGYFKYYDGGTFQAIEIPYQNNDLSMVVFLPKEKDGLDAFEKSLTGERLQEWLGKLTSSVNAAITLPKFKTESSFLMAETLKSMGMKKAFVFGHADFSGMADTKELFISEVIHKAFVDVNEEGTEAAAATGVLTDLSEERMPSKPVIFRADHRFIFLIRDTRSKGILFMGRVSNPAL